MPNHMDMIRSIKSRGTRLIHTHPKHWGASEWVIVLVLVLLLAIILRIILTKASNSKQRVILPISVTTALVKKQNVPVYLSALGTVTPTDTVTIKTQINGILLKVLFEEGQMVNAGDMLAQIDPQIYEAQLQQFEGQLARDAALLQNAKLDLTRYETLYKQDSVSQQILDTQRALVHQYEGTVALDQGQINGVKVSLAYTQIRSPFDGRVGLRQVDPGNFVQTSDVNGLVVLNRIHPITVIFTIPEDSLPFVIEQVQQGKILETEAYDRSQNKLLSKGKLQTTDNQIDPTTGTIKLKASFDNKDNRLFPNQFVNIQLLTHTLQNAVVIPTAAVQMGVKGSFVYMVKKHNNTSTATLQPVKVLVTSGDNVAVTGDIVENQAVVIEGADKLTEGAIILETKAHSDLVTPSKITEPNKPIDKKRNFRQSMVEMIEAIKGWYFKLANRLQSKIGAP